MKNFLSELNFIFEQNEDTEAVDNQKLNKMSDTETTEDPNENMDAASENEENINNAEDENAFSQDNMDLDSPDEGPTLEQIGRSYELKRIYNRLLSIRNHLSIFVEDEFDNLKNSITKAIDLFDLLINNYKQYEDKIDDIILLYYKFINEIYEITNKKYKKYSYKNNNKTKSPFETNI